jgi:hypothetical protein
VENFFEILVFNEKFFQSPQVRTQNFSKLDFAKKNTFSQGCYLVRIFETDLRTFFKYPNFL